MQVKSIAECSKGEGHSAIPSTFIKASVTFAMVVVRFVCLRFPYNFFGIVCGYKLRRMCLHCLRSPCDFFQRQTRKKPYRGLADIVRQPQGIRAVIVLSSQPPNINCMMTLRKSQGVGTLTVHCHVSMCMDLNGHPFTFWDVHLNRVSKSCDDKSCYQETIVFC